MKYVAVSDLPVRKYVYLCDGSVRVTDEGKAMLKKGMNGREEEERRKRDRQIK